MGIPAGMFKTPILIKLEALNSRDEITLDNYNNFSRDRDNDISLHTDNSSPMGIARKDDDNIYVGDGNQDEIFHYGLNGVLSARHPLATHNTLPLALTHNPNDNEFMVVDNSDQVYEYDDSSFANNNVFNLTADNNNPSGIVVTGSRYWVSDRVEDKVFVYNRFSNHHLPSEDFEVDIENPYGMAVKGNAVWIVDRSTDTVLNLATGETWTPEDVSDLWDVLFYDNLSRAYALDFLNRRIRAYKYPADSTKNRLYKALKGSTEEYVDVTNLGRFSAGRIKLTIHKDTFTKEIDNRTFIYYDDKDYLVLTINERTVGYNDYYDIIAGVYDG